MTDHHAHDRGRKARTPEETIRFINSDHPCCIPIGDVCQITTAYQSLAESYADLVRERDEAIRMRNEYLETAQSQNRSFNNAKDAWEAAESLNRELVAALRKAVASMEIATNCKFGVLPELRAAINSATPKQGEGNK